MFPTGEDSDFWSATDDPGPDRHNIRWMEGISDSKLLSELSIPGTHYTRSYGYSGILRHRICCQSWTLPIQLNMGVRFLDIRCRSYFRDMPLHHGNCYIGCGLTSVLNKVKSFLEDNPSECVILRIKQVYSDFEGTYFRDKLQPIFKKFLSHI